MRRVALVAIAGVLLVAPAAAQAAFPGQNGKLAYVASDAEFADDEIFVSNADGTSVMQLTHNEVDDADPAWSPDGSKIAFERRASQISGRTQIWVMNADGSVQTQITDDPVLQAFQPAWSPDGNRIAFVKACESTGSGGECLSFRLATMNADGSGQTPGTVAGAREPEWSADGERIVFFYNPFSVEQYGLATARPDGTDLSVLVFDALNVESPHWSPDGSRIVLALDWAVSIMNRDGSGLRQYDIPQDVLRSTVWSPDGRWILYYRHPQGWRLISPEFTDEGPSGGPPADLNADPDWQPIPINAYPRPKGASPTDVSLVPAYEPCTSTNREHGPPLAFPSCNPPAQKPGELTVGTPDANGQGAKSNANLRINPLRGDPQTPADEADVRLRANITDVRLRSDLSDYTGSLEVRLAIQITDKDNTPHPGGPGAGTVQEFTHSHPLPCSVTADTTVGSTCQFDTTLEALVPGAVKELTRGIWELKRIQVHDGAGNLFLTPGVFVP